MNDRAVRRAANLALGALGFAAVILLPVTSIAAGKSAATAKSKAATPANGATLPRTADGHPDLQGVWFVGTLTPLERPEELGEKAVLTEQEAADYQRRLNETRDHDKNRVVGSNSDLTKAYNQVWYDDKSIVGTRRTSLVIEPRNGRIPPLTPDGRKSMSRAVPESGFQDPRISDSWLDRGLWERCITRGLPSVMLPGSYNDYYQILQTPGYVVIAAEMIHDARIIPMDGRPHVAPSVRQWLGDSRGHWEGDTLVVETTNFNEKTSYYGARDHLRLVERFTRLDDKTLNYQVTVEDPTTFTSPWKIEVQASKNPRKIYEYACHEGNYAMPNLLAGARQAEKEQAAKESARKP